MVLVRQLTSNAAVRAPSTDAEATLGVNAFARLHLPGWGVPTSWSESFASWQFTGTSADPGNGSIFREVQLTDVTDAELTPGSGPATLRNLVAMLQNEQPPLLPLAVLETGDTVTIRYAAPSPLGLLP